MPFFKRYLIFGSNSPQTNVLKNNSLYGVQSDHGFFYVSVLAEKTASILGDDYNIEIIKVFALPIRLLIQFMGKIAIREVIAQTVPVMPINLEANTLSPAYR